MRRESAIAIWLCLFGWCTAVPGQAPIAPVVEFYNSLLDHYFISSLQPDIDALDSGKFSGWARTGRMFRSAKAAGTDLSPVCRFYLPPAVGDSHFYSASPAECADVRAKFPAFEFESDAVMYMGLPDARTGACYYGWEPIYRLWNKRADTNHRYVADLAARADMLAKGYLSEGYGGDGVAMCAPPATLSPATLVAFLDRYRGYPTQINPEWSEIASLKIRSADFAVTSLQGDVIPYQGQYWELFYGTFGDLLGDGSVTMVQGSWAASTPENLPGSLHVIFFGSSGISSVLRTEIEGTANPYIANFLPGPGRQIFTPGFLDTPVKSAPNYLISVEVATGKLTKMTVGTPIASHQSAIGDFNGDGKPDVLAVTYQQEGNQYQAGGPLLFQWTGTQVTQSHVLTPLQFLSGSSIAFADINGDGVMDFVIGDTSYHGQDDPDGLANNHGAWLFLGRTDGTYQRVQLPPAYFLPPTYDGIQQNFEPCCGVSEAQMRSHQMQVTIADVNGDGRKDIIISTFIWSNQTPFGIVQFLIQQPDGTFVDETAKRVFGWKMPRNSPHQVWWMDVNGDGFPDLVLSDNSLGGDPTVGVSCFTQGNDVLFNDGEGHFISAMQDAFCDFAPHKYYVEKFIPYMEPKTARLGFVNIVKDQYQNLPSNSWRYLYTHVIANSALSTGPNFKDPAASGVPGFNEWYYLFHYPDARLAVASGQYPSGLAYYQAIGRARGDKTHAAPH